MTSTQQTVRCDLCYLDFSGDIQLENHRNGRHPMCYDCNSRFRCPYDLQQHMDDVHRKGPTCGTCDREFRDENELRQHMKVHRPKNVSCPVCGDTRFASNANAVAHIESGYCDGCLGADRARDAIYVSVRVCLRSATKEGSWWLRLSSCPCVRVCVPRVIQWLVRAVLVHERTVTREIWQLPPRAPLVHQHTITHKTQSQTLRGGRLQAVAGSRYRVMLF